MIEFMKDTRYIIEYVEVDPGKWRHIAYFNNALLGSFIHQSDAIAVCETHYGKQSVSQTRR